jgi:hypothetical protein
VGIPADEKGQDKFSFMLIDQFNETIDEWITSLDRYSRAELLFKPGPENWSIGQVYMHLLNETRYYITQIKECLITEDNADEAMKEAGVTMLSNNAFPDTRIKGEPDSIVKIQQPPDQLQMKQEMAELKKEMNQIWEKILHQETKGKTRHPGLGYFNSREWFQFAEMHLRHHFRQRSRIEKALQG